MFLILYSKTPGLTHNQKHQHKWTTYGNIWKLFSTVGLFLDSYCYFQLIYFLYPGNVNYTILLQSKYWLSANIHVSFDTLLYLIEVFKILCLKFCFIVFQCVSTNYTRSCQYSRMYHGLYCWLLLTLKFYTIQDKTAQVLKFSKVSLGQGTQY